MIDLKKGLNRYVLTDEIYALIKEQIINHDIAPGEKINIDQLGRELEVSNIPIREALSRLTSEGLVNMVPFKGMYATEMSLQELDEIFEIRLDLEGLAIRKAAPRIPETLLANVAEEMKKWSVRKPADSNEKIVLIAEMNESLHGLILDYCDNTTLKNLILVYIERIQRYLSFIRKDMEQNVIEEEWAEHMLVIDALQAKDFAAAERNLLQHIQNSHRRTRNFFI
ncbi:GntR family transcriptional regulator [Cohnella soli]|uniref:GntR family transcriptional regulator n=1 Tax=Cohnella soli TaxID=425005 RepID=A0ABW0HVA2_9BACL